jgi:hypothetical protein
MGDFYLAVLLLLTVGFFVGIASAVATIWQAVRNQPR